MVADSAEAAEGVSHVGDCRTTVALIRFDFHASAGDRLRRVTVSDLAAQTRDGGSVSVTSPDALTLALLRAVPVLLNLPTGAIR